MNKYQSELDEFQKNFKNCKDKRILLYGIGRYTATILEGIKDFQFVGLMDKDPEKVGTEVFGLPIVDIQMAEQIADMVIINTSETYWQLIYNRIREIQLPVYYKNGLEAKTSEQETRINPYQELSMEALYRKIEEAEVVSFDFFDTLFQRMVCTPRDVFALLFRGESPLSCDDRVEARTHVSKHYSLEELYHQIQQQTELSGQDIKTSLAREIEIEKQMLVPRDGMLECMKHAIGMGKSVYIVTDMYMPKSFYVDVLSSYRIALPEDCILVSNELNACKDDGTLWEYYANHVLQGRKGLHIGDNKKADIKKAADYGIETYHTPNAWELLSVSSLHAVQSDICKEYDSAVMGCVLKHLLSSPFSLTDAHGKIQINSNYDMGYAVFGPIILTFLEWLLQKSRKDQVNRLLFLARDGYFLQQDYEYLCGLKQKIEKDSNQESVSIESEYVGISRQLAMKASICTEEDLYEYMHMPYTGTVAELFQDRLDIEIPLDSTESVEYWIEQKKPQIMEHVACVKERYVAYLDKLQINNNCAIVDLGYYGNNQRYLNKLTGKQMKGYYFNGNLSEENPNASAQQMEACFQKALDAAGDQSQVLKRMIYLESFLTAPYGMVKEVDEAGNFICAEKRQNQRLFANKEEMNQGVRAFIKDYITTFGAYELEPNPVFADSYYGLCFGGGYEYADEVKQSFFNDNAMMHRMESMLFY